MKKNVSSQSMDATLQGFLGNKPSLKTPKPEPQPADTQEQASGVISPYSSAAARAMPLTASSACSASGG